MRDRTRVRFAFGILARCPKEIPRLAPGASRSVAKKTRRTGQGHPETLK